MTIHQHQKGGGLVKVLFHLEEGAWHGSATETLWAERVDQRRFRLRNVPFYAFGVAVEDVVFVKSVGDSLEFDGISLRGGHSTYRINGKVAADAENFRLKWQQLQQLGCTYEQGPGRLMAVDVPQTTDIYTVYKVLEQGERDGLWEFEEGHCGHPVSG